MFKCTCNKKVNQPNKEGYTNLTSHSKNVHKDTREDDYRKSKTKMQAVLPYPKVNKKAENIFRWLEWVILENREYSSVDKPLVRKNTKLEPICQKTLQKYIDLVSLEVEKIASALPSNSGLIVDGWSQQSEHFVGVFVQRQAKDVAEVFDNFDQKFEMCGIKQAHSRWMTRQVRKP